MTKIIKIQPQQPQEIVEMLARSILDGFQTETGNDEVLDEMIRIVLAEKMEVLFSLPNGNIVSADVAWRLRHVRGLSLRHGEF